MEDGAGCVWALGAWGLGVLEGDSAEPPVRTWGAAALWNPSWALAQSLCPGLSYPPEPLEVASWTVEETQGLLPSGPGDDLSLGQ